MTYPAALGQRPLGVREAFDALEEYAAAYGRQPLKYEHLRRELRPGDERTALLIRVTESIRSLAGELKSPPPEPSRQGAIAGTDSEPEIWFASGYPGQRVVALNLLLTTSGSAGLELPLEVLQRPRSPFEQNIALRVLRRQMRSFDHERSQLVVDVIRKARGEVEGAPPTIYLDDGPCSSLSAGLLSDAQERLKITQAPATEGTSDSRDRTDPSTITFRN